MRKTDFLLFINNTRTIINAINRLPILYNWCVYSKQIEVVIQITSRPINHVYTHVSQVPKGKEIWPFYLYHAFKMFKALHAPWRQNPP